MVRRSLPWLALVAVLPACSKISTPDRATAQLVSLGGCDDAIAYARQVALDQMNKQIDALIAEDECEGDTNAEAGAASVPTAAPAATTSNGSTTGGATSVSTTNNQVAGVDEADFVKNDTQYVYLAQNGVFRIVDAWPAESAHEVAKVTLDGTPLELFVNGDRALVYVSVPDPRVSSTSNDEWGYGGSSSCTYGYECQFTGDGTSTKLELFDITDRTSPKLVREVFLSGSLISARRIGNATHTVVTDTLQLFPEVSYYPDQSVCGVPTIVRRAIYEQLRGKNHQIIVSKDLTAALPTMSDSSAADATPQSICQGLFRSPIADGAAFTTLVSLDLLDPRAPTTATIASRPGAVYASDAALYVAVPADQDHGGGWYAGYDSVAQVSAIHKFAISADIGSTAYLASGIVKGRALNQFSLDEYNGNLRVATTTGYVPDPSVESQLTILGPNGASLDQLGIVEHIGPLEDIRSVRFDGDQGFVVTFKKTDPLWVFDLSDPANPKQTGALQIPGFSTYIHLLDATHLLSIGYDANDHDSFAFFDGVLLQIFDIADPTNPTLVQRYKIGTRGTSTDALTNHLAFNYFEPLKMLALPMTICEGGGDGTFGDQLTFSGLMLFDIDAQAGIAEHGRVAFPIPDLTTYEGGDVTCFNWWTQASSDVHRSIFYDRDVYSISDSLLKVDSVDATSPDLQSLSLQQ